MSAVTGANLFKAGPEDQVLVLINNVILTKSWQDQRTKFIILKLFNFVYLQ